MESDASDFVPWECPQCGQTALARPDYLIRCICGSITRSIIK